jgi:hypothetical protein
MAPVDLLTPTAIAPGASFTTDTGVVVRVLGAVPGGLSVQVEDPTKHLVDRTAEFGTPAAASAPTACVIPGLGVHNIAYRDTSGRLHELWRDAQGQTGTSNLTQLAGAPAAVGNPFALVDTARSTEILLFRGGDGTVRSLYWSTGPVGHDDLSGTAGAPRADGDPVGYYFAPADMFHVVYRGTDDHLHELYWTGVAPVGYGGNLTGTIGAPKAAGTPSGFINAAGVNIVAYRSVDGRILSVYWAEGPSGLDDLSGTAGTPPAAGDPFGYYTTHETLTRSSTAASTTTSTSCTGLVSRPLPGGTSPPPPARRPRRATRAPSTTRRATSSTWSTAPPTAGCTSSGGHRAVGRRPG